MKRITLALGGLTSVALGLFCFRDSVARWLVRLLDDGGFLS